MYGLAEYAHDTEKRLHGVHPDQGQGAGQQGTEMKMPGGRTGYKR